MPEPLAQKFEYFILVFCPKHMKAMDHFLIIFQKLNLFYVAKTWSMSFSLNDKNFEKTFKIGC